METMRRYLFEASLMFVFFSAMLLLLSFCNANCYAYQMLRENLRNQSFEARLGEQYAAVTKGVRNFAGNFDGCTASGMGEKTTGGENGKGVEGDIAAAFLRGNLYGRSLYQRKLSALQ